MYSHLTQPKQGQLLLSEPFTSDFFFKRSAVLLAEHNKEGSFGFIINRPLNLTFSDIFPKLPPIDAPIYLGGPVNRNSLFFIHHSKELFPQSKEIIKDLYWDADLKSLKKNLKSGLVQSADIKFVLGYAGWTPRQLEEEFSKDYWLISSCRSTQVLSGKTEALWRNRIKKMPNDIAIWANFPDDPQMN